MSDPAGHYRALEVDPAAAPDAIAAAYRRKARVLHPDIPVTGDSAAFIRVQQAYEVLSDAGRRAAYDRTSRLAASAPLVPPPAESSRRAPRLSDLPIAVWAALGGLSCLAAVMAVVQSGPQRATIPPVPPPAADAAANHATLAPAAVPASGPASHYVLPSGDDATVWRHDAARDAYLPAGHIAAFTPVRALRLVPQHGLVEIGLADGGTGYVDATRLTPGDRAAARRAFCAYNAGAIPRNGEVFSRHGEGTARIEISNRASEPAVVRLRDAAGRAVATVFVAPSENAVVENLPEAAYRPEYATGELWSRACGAFAAGMRAQRFAGFASPSALSPLVIPPELSVNPPPEDISDTAFGSE